MTATVQGVKTWRTDEGGGYQATLLVEGVKAATVTEEGNGGCLRWAVLNLDAVRTFAVSCGLDPAGLSVARIPCDTAMDIAVAELVDRYEETKRLQRWCRTMTVFTVPGDKAGSYRTIKAPYSATIKAHIVAKYPEAVILNERIA